MRRGHRTPWWRPRTLSRQLVLGVSAIVTVAVLGVGALSVYSMRAYAIALIDVEVTHSLAALKHSYQSGNATLTEFTGQAPGTVIAVLAADRVTQSAVFNDYAAAPAPPDAQAAVAARDWSDGSARTVELAGLGPYRAAGIQTSDGAVLVSAVSLKGADRTVTAKTFAVAVITLVAALLAAACTVALVRGALRPLRRVAATAATVARLPLADEDHRITSRVRRADSDPDHEVGVVGETLNRLLVNVDTALAARAESDRRMRRFLTDASHELRTPLAAIQGYAELTRQEGAAMPPMTEYALARIESESRRMTTLVADMLLLARLDEGQALEFEQLDLCALVVDAVNDVAVGAPDQTWTVNLPDEPVWLSGDAARLHQVLTNLLVNARVHTGPGVTVTTAVRRLDDPDPAVELSVADDGPGINPDLLPDLFGRFVRADRSRSRTHQSSGLGLAIVASITEGHDGTVAVESDGGGTVFRVRLPVAGSTRVARVTPASSL